jgi:pre-mRNA-processing factor 6
MFAKHVWQDLHRVDRARDILRRAMDALPESEDIYIAAARIEESPKHILTIARSQCPKSSRIWIKAAQVERFEKNTDEVVSVCRDALGRVSHKASDAFKLAIIPIHALLEVGRLEEAADLAGRACEVFSRSPAVWLVAADVAMQLGDLNKARSVLERARIRLPTDENLWWKGFFVEERSYGLSSPAVKAFLSRALQACPSSGLLWTCAIESEPAVTRHPKCLDALKKCPNDGLVVSAVAKLFWLEKRQIDKARKWYQNAVSLGARLGQVWSDFLAFEIAQGDDNAFNIEVMIAQIKALDPQRVNMGIEWNMYRKSMENWKKTLIELVVGFVMIRFPGVLSNMTPRVDEVLNRELADITKQE